MMYIYVSNKVNLVLDTRKEGVGLLLMYSNYVHQNPLWDEESNWPKRSVFTTSKRSCGKVIFYTCLSVILFMGGGVSVWCHFLSSWLVLCSFQGGLCPGGSPWHPYLETYWTETLLERDPHMVKSGWYASYWNVFLFEIKRILWSYNLLSSVSHHNHYTKVTTAGGRHRETFNSLQSWSTGSS